jgi:hypothetical protein
LVQGLAAALAVAWSASEAKAAWATYNIQDGGLETFTLQVADYHGGTPFSALAGGIRIVKQSGSDTHAPAEYITVCTDIGGTLYLGLNYGYNAPAGFSGQDGLNPNWGAGNTGNSLPNPNNAIAAIQNAAKIFYDHYTAVLTPIAGTPAPSLITQRAALQLAVWDALYDSVANVAFGANDLSIGRFQATGADSAAISLANSWLCGLTGNYNIAGNLLYPVVDYPTSGNNNEPPQELLMRIEDVTPVPEPTTVIAGALLLLPLGASTLRKLSKKREA